MKKQSLKKKLILGIPLFVLVVYLVYIFFKIQEKEKKSVSQGVSAIILNPEYHFVSEKEVLGLFKQKFGELKGVRHDSINRSLIELAFKENPYVEDVQVYRSASNKYQIEIKQRTPILRVMNDSTTYYLDKDAYRMPTGIKYAARVHLYRGNISQEFAKRKLVPFQLYLEEHAFWSEMIDYVEVDSKEELILYLRAKSGLIKLGKIERLSDKLEKLLLFINKVGKHKGMENYESIDLRFDNQVVCVKKTENATK